MHNAANEGWKQRGTAGDFVLEVRTGTSDDGRDQMVIRVRENGGKVRLERYLSIGQSGQISMVFSDEADAVIVTTSDGRDRVWTLD